MEANLTALSKYLLTRFFTKHASMTQKECDIEAEKITGSPVHPSHLQGSDCYTALFRDKTHVIQFRAGDSVLDMNLMWYVQHAYGRFVPHHKFVGKLGELHIYTMPIVGGVMLYLARESLKNNFLFMQTMVKDIFFCLRMKQYTQRYAMSKSCPLFDQYSAKLSQLQKGLPERFRGTLAYVISILLSSRDNSWPLVPNHNDLVSKNIHVSAETGHIEEICDWKDTTIGPFGMSLAGLEEILGTNVIGSSRVYYPKQQGLRELLYETLYQEMAGVSEEQKKLIEASRLVGLFLTHGFI